MRANRIRGRRVAGLLLGGALLIPGATEVARANPLRIVTFDNQRIGTSTTPNGSVSFNFASSNAFSTARNALSNPANFGPGGVIPQEVTISTVSDLSGVSKANADLIVLPLINYGDVTRSYSPSELAAVQSFLTAGGGLLAFSNITPIDNLYTTVLGVSGQAFPLGDHNPVTVAAPSSPLLDGPFGSIPANATIPYAYSGQFSGLGNGTAVLKSGDGKPLAATFQVGQGRAALFSDEEVFMDAAAQVDSLVHGQLTEGSNSLKLFLNSVAFAASVPEPGGLLIFLAGLGGLVGLRAMRRRGRTSEAQRDA